MREREREREREKEERAYARFSRFYIYCKSPTGLSLAVSLWYPPDQPVLRFVFMIHSCPPRGPGRRRFFPRRATCSKKRPSDDFCRPRLVTRASSKLHEIPRNEQLSQRGGFARRSSQFFVTWTPEVNQ